MERSRVPRNVYEPLKTYFLKVNINCHGCKRKVKKTLRKVEGVYSVEIDTDQQAVIVRGNLDPEILVNKLNRRGKYAELLFMSPIHKDQFGNLQAGLHHDNRSLRNAQYNFGNNHFNNVPSYERQSDGEMMMMMANNMKPVMMNDGDYFQMSDSSEDFQELFGETAQRQNYDEEVQPNLMSDMELAETINMHIPGRSNNMMMNERAFHGLMMNGPSLVPQFMNQQQFSSSRLNGFYY